MNKDVRRRARLTIALLLAFAGCAALAPAAQAGQVGVTVHIQGSGVTEVVEGSIEDGASLLCDWRAGNKDERVTKSCDRIRNEEWGIEAWVWLRPTASTVPEGHWRFSHWTGCDDTRTRDNAKECAVHSGLWNGVERSPKAHFVDDHAPTVSAVTETISELFDRHVSYSFSTNEGQLQCRIDSETDFSNCSSGIQRTFATEGDHTIDVRAVDQSGQVSGSSSRTVKVIDTAIGGGPGGLTSNRHATFGYSSGAGNAFECSLDFAPFTDCGPGTSKTYTGLTDGLHSFRVRARHGGWYDRIPAAWSWRVDGTPPDTFFGAHATTPGEGVISTLTTATFVLQSTEPGSFECKLGSATFAPCSSPRVLSGLAAGAHTFEVRAKDSAGNYDPTPASRNWTVNPPDDDGDGYNAAQDCDDANPGVNPGRPEILDNDVDENCDGIKGVDPDRDRDGSNRPADCDDNNAGINPSKQEILDNDVDENCDGVKGVNLDRDGDGAQRPADCDDGNPAVRPGAVDIPGNGVDEDCRDGDARPPIEVVNVDLAHAFKLYRRYTKIGRLEVENVPTGSTVVAQCKRPGKKCPKRARRKVVATDVAGTVALGRFTKMKLKPRTKITVTVTKPGAIGAVKVLKIRRKQAPRVSTFCLPVGSSSRSTAC